MKNDYEIRGEVTAIFITARGQRSETLIDTVDLLRAKEFEFTWYGAFNKKLEAFYVRGNTSHKRGNRTSFALHRWLFEDLEREIEIDHINHNTLDNRRSTNLRRATRIQNMQNRNGTGRNSKTGIRGVCWNKLTNNWKAQLQVNKKKIHLGQFADIAEAEKAVIEARAKLMTHSKESGMTGAN